ncbi:STAS domain-containing protein [Bacillus shivajii]|uniref:STAS domain-containing protein n=1 Tax=Bacillus shivajii TaxID=1983719 RepID=UPI001CFAF6AC|nr:STAS domain-containing protein [Bacillus shivajii]UCZ54236.1 STAS domain-containing protein [Bacillus shivajii]
MMTVNELMNVGHAIIEESENLAKQVEEAFDSQSVQSNNHIGFAKEENFQYRFEFMQMIGNALLSDDVKKNLDDVYKWGKKAGKRAVSAGISADFAMLSLPHFRKVIYKFIRKECKNRNVGFDDYFLMSERIDLLLDKAVYSFTQAYVEYNEDTFKKAQEELLELSVPVVPLTKSVAILPIIGTIDTYRSKELLDQSLTKGTELGLSYLIVDLSGVHMIDTAVAHNLFQLHDALKVVGITAIISGLRPELAQTIVNLGISFNHMKVARNLEQALMMTGLSIGTEDEVFKINE